MQDIKFHFVLYALRFFWSILHFLGIVKKYCGEILREINLFISTCLFLQEWNRYFILVSSELLKLFFIMLFLYFIVLMI